MKKIILISVLFSSIIFSQQSNPILSLKSQLTQKQHLSSSNQHQVSNSQKPEFVFDTINQEKKNPGLAILFSLLLPGMGELYANEFESGKYFTIADGLLWGTLAGFNIYGNWQEKNYRSFAETNAGINSDGKESDFFANVGSYLSVEDYNKAQELKREFGKVYDPQKYFWNWKNNDMRKEYRGMWSSSENAFNNMRFVAGALILNRLISAINAVRLVSTYNKNLEKEELSWNIYFTTQQKPILPQSFQMNFIFGM